MVYFWLGADADAILCAYLTEQQRQAEATVVVEEDQDVE